MIVMTIKNSLRGLTILALIFFAIPSLADAGHCNYRLHSKGLNRAIRVCQTVDNFGQCGELMQKDYDRSRAHLVENKKRKVKYNKGDCSLEAVVGICILPHSKLYFYEGDEEILATGCDYMKGRWEVTKFQEDSKE